MWKATRENFLYMIISNRENDVQESSESVKTMNYFIEGLQGSGKSTLAGKLSALHPEYTAIREGDYSPVELAWCAYLSESQYAEILAQYHDLRSEIMEQTFSEGDKRIVCYTKIRTDNTAFYQNMESHEIYNNRVSYEKFKEIVLSRFRAWWEDGMIFECSLFQNIVEDLILFRCASDEEIINFYRQIREALVSREYRIFYLKTDNIKGNIDIIRKERSDQQGNELWFPAMLGYFNESPYAKANGISGEAALIGHFLHRQRLELRICEEVFQGRYAVLPSKNYTDGDWK